MSVTIKGITYNNTPNKKTKGLGVSLELTQTGIPEDMTVELYLKSDRFYKILNALDIDWNGVDIGDGIVINDTSDLIAWILSLLNNIKAITQDAPSAFDTLKEFADWIANDTTGAAKMATDIETLKSGKVDKVTGKQLSTEDYTTAEKTKLAGIEAGALVNPTNVSEFTNDAGYLVEDDLMEDVIANGHEYVDLGLPSGTLWATMNVGANSVTDNGLYFSWGGTTGYTAAQVGTDKNFSWPDYELGNGGDTAADMTKYNSTDGKTVLEPADDAAVVNMGGEWHMPTYAQLQELLNTTYVTNAWVTDYQGSGVNGRLFTSVADNTKTLFFPAAGNCDNGSVSNVGSSGYVLSRSVYESILDSARYMDFGSGYVGVSSDYRCLGYSVRGVIKSSKSPKYATKVELNAKQDIIDSSHKLNADLIENGTTNKVINVKPDWNAASGSDAEILNKPSLATVATSGSYNDLKNKPTIPSLSGYATLNYVGLQIYYALNNYQSILLEGNTLSSPTGTIGLQIDALNKFTNVNTLNIDCSNILNSSQRAVLLLQTGSNPDISFVYNNPNGNHNDFYGTTGIMYAGSSGVFLANSKYMIYFTGSNIGCIITQFKLSDTPVSGENGVEETTGEGPGWRTIEGSSYNGEILVDSAGKVVMIELPETVFYRYLENGSTYAICDPFTHAVPPQEQLIASSFGTQTYNCTINSDNSPIYKYTLTIDGTKYVITYNASDHTMTTSPELGKWSAPGLYWRTSKDSSFQKVLVDYTGKVFADGPWDSIHTAYFTINSGGSFLATGGAGKPQNSISTYGVSEYSGQWDESHVLLTVTVNGIAYTITYDGTNGGVSPEITDWVEE